MILRALAAAAVIALLAIAWLALNGESSGPAAPATATLSAQSPGYSARNAVLIETGPDGLPMYTLRAADIREQPASQSALLDRVQMQFHDAAGRLWQGRADEARVIDQATEVELSGDVALSGALPNTAAPLRISTDRLKVDTHSEVVTTHDAVTIALGSQQLRARGLIARLRQQSIRLQSQVHGRYAP